MSEWQPIETAPKDGTRVLLRLRYYHPPEPDKIWADIGSWRPDYLDDNQMWRDDFGDAIVDISHDQVKDPLLRLGQCIARLRQIHGPVVRDSRTFCLRDHVITPFE